MALVLVTAPSEEPVTAAEAKSFLRVDTTADDTLITELIKAARQISEGEIGPLRRAHVTQTWDLVLDGFPSSDGVIELKVVPVSSVTSITYLDVDGATQTLPIADYTVDTKSKPGRIVPAYGKSWPSTRDALNTVTVRFVAGHGAAAAVPEAIKREVKALLTQIYERREQVVPGAGWLLA